MTWSRRNLFRWAGRGGLALPLLARAEQEVQRKSVPAGAMPGASLNRKLKVVFVGAHVDDWIDCAGPCAVCQSRARSALLSFTPGDSRSMAAMNEMGLEELARIRRQDVVKGAKILGAEIRFLDQHNQNMQVSPEVYDRFNKLLMDEKPDVVFGMWPLEFHPDHRAARTLRSTLGSSAD